MAKDKRKRTSEQNSQQQERDQESWSEAKRDAYNRLQALAARRRELATLGDFRVAGEGEPPLASALRGSAELGSVEVDLPGAKAAAVALVIAALTSGATATSVDPNCTLDVLGDTGEHLGSREAFMNQGVASNVVDQFCGTSSSHVAFETGGGKKHSNESIGNTSR